ADSVDDLVGKLFRGHIEHIETSSFSHMPDRVKKMGLAQSNSPVEKKRIIDTARIFRHGLGGCMSQLIRFSSNKCSKGVTWIQQSFAGKEEAGLHALGICCAPTAVCRMR